MLFLLAIADLIHPLSNNRSSIGMIDDCFISERIPGLILFGSSVYLVTTAEFVADHLM